MGWVIVALFLLLTLSVISFFQGRKKKLPKNRNQDPDLYQKVRTACQESDNNSGEFEVPLSALSDTTWLSESGEEGLAEDQFQAVVKWRNKGNECIYKIVATADINDEQVTRSSETFTAEL